MDAYNEQRLINEVIFLHGLWHQGPPGRQNPRFPAPEPSPQQHQILGRQNPRFPAPEPSPQQQQIIDRQNPRFPAPEPSPQQHQIIDRQNPRFPAPEPSPQQHQIIDRHPALSVSSTTTFKKSGKKKMSTSDWGIEWPSNVVETKEGSASGWGIEWPSNVVETKEGSASGWGIECPSNVVETKEGSASGWGIECPSNVVETKEGSASGLGKLSGVSDMHDISTDDREKFAVSRMQQKVVRICNQFFATSDDDEDDDDDEEDGSGDNGVSEEHKFFRRVFVENVRFREYYEKNYEIGEFCCLVCCRKGKKVFKGCQGLVQHSYTISKKGRRAHRALARVVCEVLGWNYDRLPTIVLTGKPLSLSLVDSGIIADSDKKEVDAGTSIADVVHGDNGESAVRKVDDAHETSAKPQINVTASTTDIVNCDNGETVKREVSNPDQFCVETVVPNLNVKTEENADSDKKELYLMPCSGFWH